MKRVKNPFDWHYQDWYWPDHDEKLLQVIDWVHDLDQVLPLIDNRRVCIQAGGATGVWAEYLSKFFKRVCTYEPCEENYRALLFNVGINVEPFNMALSDKLEAVDMYTPDSEEKNAGAGYTLPVKSGIPAVPIDHDHDGYVDFICLDVEGYEEKVLKGAAKTIERCNPVIMIEEKALPQFEPGHHLKARKYLESIGYKEVFKIHRDVVFKRD